MHSVIHLPEGGAFKNGMSVPSPWVSAVYMFCFVPHIYLYKLLKAGFGAIPSTC